MADPTVIQCTDACTVTVVHEFAFPPFNLTEDDGAQIGGAILLLWAGAWAFRVLIRQIKGSDGDSTQPEEET